MRRLFSTLVKALMSALCLAPAAVLAGNLALRDMPWMLAMLGCVTLSAIVLSYLPGTVGNRRREVTVRTPYSSKIGGDPNPDRERPVEDVRMRGVSVPVRFPCAVLVALAFAAATLAVPRAEGVTIVARAFAALFVGVLTVALARDVAASEPLFAGIRGATVGLIIYAFAAIVCFFMKDAAFNTILVALTCVFLFVTGFQLNDQSLAMGVASMTNTRPSRQIVRRNRVMLWLFAAVVAAVGFFDRIRAFCEGAAQKVARAVLRAIQWLMSLFPASEEAAQSGMGGGDMGDMGLPAGEASPFWAFMEKVGYVFAFVIVAVLAFLGARILWRKARVLLRAVAERMRQLAAGMGEEYRDEQESLFDMDDMKNAVQTGFKKRLDRLFLRGKRWEQMDAREKARHIVRQLYRRAGAGVRLLGSRTVREAVMEMPSGTADKGEICAQYELARYSESAPDEATLEKLRRASGV